LVLVTTFIRHSHMLTILPDSSPLPYGTLGRHPCLTVRVLAFAGGYVVGGALQGGLAPSPHPPRVLPMGRQVLSWLSHARQSHVRPRVAR
jgi:hypothetical protein